LLDEDPQKLKNSKIHDSDFLKDNKAQLSKIRTYWIQLL